MIFRWFTRYLPGASQWPACVRLGVEALESRLVPSGDPFLEASGTVLRDGHGSGDPVLLQGTHLGSWLVTEGWMSPRDSSGLPDDYSARQTLIDRFGAATADSLLATYQDAWITTRDLDNIQALGMNVIRLPFWYRNLQDEDGTWRADAFDRMDWLVSNAWARGIYTILDCHGVVGGQSTAEHTGRSRTTAEFWSSPIDQQRTADIWQAIAAHFRDNPAVAGYDLINEPMSAPSSQALWNVYDQLYHTIRAVDPDHMITLEGTYGSWNWNMLPDPARFGWTNVVYQMHEYQWNSTTDPNGVKAGIDHQVADFRAHQSWNVPCFIGEFNEFGPGTDPTGVWRYAVQQFQSNGMNWTEWSYKSTAGGGSNSWGIYNPVSPRPAVPNLRTDSAEVIRADWAAWTTDNTFAINPMLQAALSLNSGSILPAGFSDADIGSTHLTGGASYDPSSGTWLVWGSGSDIWGTADQFHQAAVAVNGDQTLVARITGLANTDPWAKAGVMLRDSSDPGSPFADLLATQANGVAFQWRGILGATCGSVQVSGIPAPTPAAPVWVALTRTGNTFSGYYSTDGITWQQVGSGQNLAFSSSDILAGLAVTSHNNNALNTSTFDNVYVSGLDPTTPINLAGSFNQSGSVSDGTTFSGGLDGHGAAYSADLLGTSLTAGGSTFQFGDPATLDAVLGAGQTLALPAGRYSTLTFLGTAVNGNQADQTFVVHYTDGTSDTFTQSLSDWYTPQGYAGESVAATMSYSNRADGRQDNQPVNLYQYSFQLDSSKTISSLTLPDNGNVAILAMDLVR